MARILLVDDEDLVRRVVRVVLEAEGHEVAEASSGEQALDEVERAVPDAVILDLIIPGMDGFEICKKLKAIRPGPKVLVLSGIPATDSGEEARAAGADDVMSKPFSALDLLSRLTALLES
ncbi:MAG TPA: response regulator transcription factor [Actinomycetota bacterium]|nr:response regulator transcription factor [Actinomycetota bacterium]